MLFFVKTRCQPAIFEISNTTFEKTGVSQGPLAMDCRGFKLFRTLCGRIQSCHLADRKVVGWSLSEDMKVESITYQAWIKARRVREINERSIFHSDRGVQYAAHKMTNLFSFNKKVKQSMSRKGNCWDNAVAESFFKSIKHEWINRCQYENYGQAYESIQQYINWYNNYRLHSALGYLTPLEKEIQIRKVINNAA